MTSLHFTNRNGLSNNDSSWTGDLAVPETVIQAKTSAENQSRLTIAKEDLLFIANVPRAG